METNRQSRVVFVAAILSAALVLAPGCRRDPSGEPGPPDLAPFVELARTSDCAGLRNWLFLIDDALVFWERRDDCSDASYGYTLFGRNPHDVLCDLQDSIAGPMKGCSKPIYEDMFEIMIKHLDDPDLGLGPGHAVERIAL